MKLRKPALMNEFYNAWWFIKEHPELNKDDESPTIDVFVTKVNPKTGLIDDSVPLNTEVDVWVELHTIDARGIGIHYPQFDTGGLTYEEAVINMAKLVKNFNFADTVDE